MNNYNEKGKQDIQFLILQEKRLLTVWIIH